jgi:hypothetical protein
VDFSIFRDFCHFRVSREFSRFSADIWGRGGGGVCEVDRVAGDRIEQLAAETGKLRTRPWTRLSPSSRGKPMASRTPTHSPHQAPPASFFHIHDTLNRAPMGTLHGEGGERGGGANLS